MAKRNSITWKPGLVVRKTVDGYTYYGQFLEEPWAVFVDFRTEEPSDDAAAIVDHPALFTVGTGYPLVEGEERWEAVGEAPIPHEFDELPERFVQSPVNPERVQILDAGGQLRDSSVEEVRGKGLWSAALWNPDHIESALADHFAGRPSAAIANVQLKTTSTSPTPDPTDQDPTDQGIR